MPARPLPRARPSSPARRCELAALDLAAKLARLPDRAGAVVGRSPVDNHGDVLTGYGKFDPPTTPLDANGQGVPYACYGFATQVALVQVDLDLGTVKVLKIAAAHDVGKAVNPQQVEGQIHGGVAQGMGLALMEEYIPGRTENLHDYLIPTFGDMPEMFCVIVDAPTARSPRREGRRRAGADLDRAGDLRRHPSRDRRAGDQGAGAAAPPARGDPSEGACSDDRTLRLGARGRWRHPLRCLPGAVPHPAGQARRLRPLRQRRGQAGAHRSAGAARPSVESGAARCASSKARETGTANWCASPTRSSPASAPPPPIPTTSRRHSSSPVQIDGVDCVTVVTEGIFSYCGVKVKIDTDRYRRPGAGGGARQGRADRARHHPRIRLADALPRRRAAPDRRFESRKATSRAML